MSEDRELETALGRVLAASGDDAAAGRVLARLATLPAQKHRLAWWPTALMDRDFAPAWPRVAALAGAAVLGMSIGLSSLGNRIAADLDLVWVATADDASTNVFDIDSVTGPRP
jgi:hypothetical protein